MSAEMYGLDGEPLPDGWTPLEAIAVVKALDENGHVGHSIRATSALDQVEGLGMLRAALTITERDVLASFVPAEDDDDD